MQFLADLILDEQIMASPQAVEGQENPFIAGKVGVYFGGTWDEIQVRSAGFDWDFVPMPGHPTTGKRAVSTDSNAWGILSTSENQDAAWEVVKFLIGPEAQRGLMALGIPVLSDVVESPEFLEAHAPQAIETVIADFAEVGHDIYPTPDANEWWDAVQQEYSVVWSGEATVEEAAQRATDRVNEIFSRRPPEWSE
jgi:multiple sugar transport system substrate-binding protein